MWRRDLPRQRRCVEISGERRRRRVKRRHDAKRGKGRTLLGRKLLREGGRVELFRRRQQRRRRRVEPFDLSGFAPDVSAGLTGGDRVERR